MIGQWLRARACDRAKQEADSACARLWPRNTPAGRRPPSDPGRGAPAATVRWAHAPTSARRLPRCRRHSGARAGNWRCARARGCGGAVNPSSMGVSMPMRECIECASGGVRQVRRRQEEIAGGTRGDGQACPGWVRTQEGGHLDEKVQPRFAMIQCSASMAWLEPFSKAGKIHSWFSQAPCSSRG